MATENTGGWQLTTSTYANGGRMETVGDDGKVTATLNNDADQGGPRAPQGDALGGQLDGLDLRLRLGLDQPGVRRRARSACSPAAPTCTRRWSRTTASSPRTTASPIIPLEGADAGVLGGGTLAAVNVVTDEAERDAAVKWIDFYYMQKLLTQEGAVADAEALKANNQPVGVPALPIFDKATYDQSQEWIKDYINVPTAQMAPVHVADLRPADRDRADGPHPGALRGPRPRRAGRPHRQERRHRRPARCRQQAGPGHPRPGLMPSASSTGPRHRRGPVSSPHGFPGLASSTRPGPPERQVTGTHEFVD